jgi:molybdate transport system ATP-binding protein
MPALLVTHDLEEALELGDRMHVFREGRIVQSGTPQAILDSPGSADIARLLGIYNLLPAQIVSLDPGRNVSKLRVGEWEIGGLYYPGHLKGDRVMMCVVPGQVRVEARNGYPRANTMGLDLQHVVAGPDRARLLFAGGFRAEIPRAEWEQLSRAEEFAVEIPPAALRLVKG